MIEQKWLDEEFRASLLFHMSQVTEKKETREEVIQKTGITLSEYIDLQSAIYFLFDHLKELKHYRDYHINMMDFASREDGRLKEKLDQICTGYRFKNE